MNLDSRIFVLQMIFLAVFFRAEVSIVTIEKAKRLSGSVEFWERVGNREESVDLKKARLSGFIEGRLGLEPPKWWQDRIDWYANFERVGRREVNEEENHTDRGVVRIRQLIKEIEVHLVDTGSKVRLQGAFGNDFKLCYSAVRLLDSSILVACNERDHYLVFRITSTGELLWERRIVWEDRVAVGYSGNSPKPAECEIKLDKDKETAIFFGARPQKSIIAELDLETGSILDSAFLKQASDQKYSTIE